ncbi:uncharacterized protein LOC131938404 [Physella acuta]|uniref:uncharacterized protein LOC131938404 n=1 Tax=Physella acuta TaxID=109671 RepID=UPI0027DB099D|nr:uncharacterized protein LOC131938404 [Physella acuta]
MDTMLNDLGQMPEMFSHPTSPKREDEIKLLSVDVGDTTGNREYSDVLMECLGDTNLSAQLINRSDQGAGENMFELTLSQAIGVNKDSHLLGSYKLNRAQYNLKTKLFFIMCLIMTTMVNGSSASSCSSIGEDLGLCSNTKFCTRQRCYDQSEFIIKPEYRSTLGSFLEVCGLVGGFLYLLKIVLKIIRAIVFTERAPIEAHAEVYLPEPQYAQPQVPPYGPPQYAPPQYTPPQAPEQQYAPPQVQGQQYAPPQVQGQQYAPPQVQGQQYAPPQVQGQQYAPPQVQGQQYAQPQVQGQQYAPPQVQGQQYAQPQVQGQQYAQPQAPGPQYASPQAGPGPQYAQPEAQYAPAQHAPEAQPAPPQQAPELHLAAPDVSGP